MDVTLASLFNDFIRQKVESGQFPSEEAVLMEVMRRFHIVEAGERVTDEEVQPPDPIEYEAIAHAAREIEGKDVPSIEEVRRILAKVPGSMAQAVIEEREDRF